MNHKTQTAELIRTVELIVEHGIKSTSEMIHLTPSATTYRVRRLEKQLGFRIFAPYDYDRLTWHGREYLRSKENG